VRPGGAFRVTTSIYQQHTAQPAHGERRKEGREKEQTQKVKENTEDIMVNKPVKSSDYECISVIWSPSLSL
jgi:hypothetical protein